MGKVVTMGEALIVLDPEQSGPLGQVDTFRRRLGGAEVNVAVGLARLGSNVEWFGRLGDDPFGQWIFRYLRGEGIDVSNVQFDSQKPTGLYVKERRMPEQINSYYYRSLSAASFLSPQLIQDEIFKDAIWLHLTGITPALSDSCRDATFQIAQRAQRKGIKITFDPNLRLKLWSAKEAKDTITELASLATIVLPGLDEGIALWGEDFGWDKSWPEDLAAEKLGGHLLSFGPEMVVVKLGERGVLLVEREKSTFLPAFSVSHPVDTVGAGDGFAAGLLYGLMESKNIKEAIQIGQAVASCVVSSPGDLEGLPTLRELELFLGRREGVER